MEQANEYVAFVGSDGTDSKSIVVKDHSVDRRKAVAESRDSLVSQPICATEEMAETSNKHISVMYSVMADFIEQNTTTNLNISLEVKEMKILIRELQGKVESLIEEKQALEKTNIDLHKKIADLRATIITAMTREIETLRRDMETQRHDVQKKSMDEVRSYLESLPTVETKFQDMLREQRSALARSMRKTTRTSLSDTDLLTGFVEEHILPLQHEIDILKAKLSG